MDVGYLLRRITGETCGIDAQQVALQLEDGPRWTYQELHEVSNRYANAFLSMGVQKGDRIGILLYNCLEYWAVYFAAAKIGAIAVRLNFRLVSEELEYALNDSGTKILCLEPAFVERIAPIRDVVTVTKYICLCREGESCPDWCEPWEVLMEGDPDLSVPIQIDAQDPVMLMYTSGTTGRPKGALWTHANTLWFSSMQVMKWGLQATDVSMTTGPLYHVGAMEDLALPTLLAGGRVIITKSGGFDIRRVLRVMEKENVTYALLFPFMIYDMLNLEDLDAYSLSGMKAILSGGDPVMPWAIERLNEKFPHIGLIQIYGLTEGTPIAASLDPQDAANKGHTVGKPLPLVEIKIADDSGRTLKRGEIGEIWIKSPAVAREYWGKPEATRETFVDGWCKTGDLGRIDEDGYLIISGRKKDMIRSGGENIYPAELEDVLIRHPGIKDVAIIGVPDPKYLETVCAVIVPKPGAELTEEEVIRYSREHLAGYKTPRHVVFVEELPRTPSGKITKYKLREAYRHLGER